MVFKLSDDAKRKRIEAVLTKLAERPSGWTCEPLAKEIGLSKEHVRSCILNDLVADGRVNITKSRGGARRPTYWYHITPKGQEFLMGAPVSTDVKGDWSETPTLAPAKKDGTVRKMPATPVRKETERTPTASVGNTPAKDTAPAKDEDLMTVEGLERVLNTLRTLRSDDDDIDFDIGAIISKAEAKMKASVMACPHCGGEMAVENVGDNKMLVCKGCCLAVTYKRNPRDLGALVKAWNRRTSA